MNKEVLQAKQAAVSEIVEKAKANKSLVVVSYRGLSVAKITEIRRALRKENASLCVYKNSMVHRAADELGWSELDQYLEGPNAFLFAEDATASLKTIAKYARRLPGDFDIKAGVIEGKVVDSKAIVELSKIPGGKSGLLSMFLSVLQAPVRQFAVAVQAIADKK